MRTYLWIVVVGVLLGLICRLGLSQFGGTEDETSRFDARMTKVDKQTDASARRQHVSVVPSDPLVPPANVLGNTSTEAKAAIDAIHSVSPSTAHVSFTHDARAIFEPHGEKVCASGCAASRHPTRDLTKQEYHELLARYAHEPMDETSEAFEALLYFGRQTRQMLDSEGSGPLDPLRDFVLREELKFTHAKIAMRVVDDNGEIRSSLPPTRVPLDRRHVFVMDTNNVQPLITSGTVKRVGLYHLWTRL